MSLRGDESSTKVLVTGMNSVLRKRVRIEEKLKIWREQLSILQQECAHPNAEKIFKSDTGNWDRSQDSYWKDCRCPDCGKFWTEPQ